MKYFTKVAEAEKSPNVKPQPQRGRVTVDKKTGDHVDAAGNTIGNDSDIAAGGNWGNLKDKVVSGAKWYGGQMKDYATGKQGLVPDVWTGGNPTRETLNTAKDSAVDWAANKYKKHTDISPGGASPAAQFLDEGTVPAMGPASAIVNAAQTAPEGSLGNAVVGAAGAVGNAIKDPLVNAAKVTGNTVADIGTNLYNQYKPKVQNAGNVLYNSWKDSLKNKPAPEAPKAKPDAPDTSPELPAE